MPRQFAYSRMAAQYFSCFFNQQQPHGEVLQGELAFFWLKHFMQKHKGIMRNQFYFVSVQLQHEIIYDVNSILSWKKTKKNSQPAATWAYKHWLIFIQHPTWMIDCVTSSPDIISVKNDWIDQTTFISSWNTEWVNI